MEIIEANKYRNKIIALLKQEKLPADLPAPLENFFATIADGQFAGVAGLEVYGEYGLLRSLVIGKTFRGQGIANALLKHVEEIAAAKKLLAIYLLTETAANYFGRKGYREITRAEVHADVQQSAEFNYACPQSAVVMRKSIA